MNFTISIEKINMHIIIGQYFIQILSIPVYFFTVVMFVSITFNQLRVCIMRKLLYFYESIYTCMFEGEVQ